MRAVTGTVLGGRYRLTEPIASGGMGEVWQAHDDLLGRTVAVKVLREELVSEPGFLERFRTEARNTARLAHANIATTYDYGESDGSAWLVMELVPGEPLSDLISREGAIEPRRAMRLLARAAAGLAAAHAAGIVHRDVKPGNLLVTPDGQVKVTDFGIARAAAEAPLTATGQVMGTAAYLAPEQATGRRDLTPAVDVYALGVVAHEMLAGERPFTGESQVAIALAQVNDPPPPLPRWVPGSARELVALCLAKDARDRPSQAGVVAEVASRIADGDDAGAVAVLERSHGQGGFVQTGRVDPTVVALPPTSVLPPEATGAPAWESAAAAGGLAGAGAATRRVPWPEPAVTGSGEVRGAPVTGASAPAPVEEPTSSARRRLTFPLLGLVAVLLVILVALLWHSLGSSGGAGTDTPSTPVTSSAPAVVTPSSTAPTSPTPTTASDTPSTTASSPSTSASESTATTPSTSASPTDSGSASASSDDSSSSPATSTPTSPSATSASPTTASATPAAATTAG